MCVCRQCQGSGRRVGDRSEIPLRPFHFNDVDSQIAVVASHFASWPTDKSIVANARGADLAPVLLLAGLHNRSLHITNVMTKDGILLISLSKAKQLKVACDVSV
ncbi:hypothetical protein CERSUDRAFT_60693, partial [Gelatoporia subvermispora B]